MPTKYHPNISLEGTLLSSSEHKETNHRKLMWHRLLAKLFSSGKLYSRNVEIQKYISWFNSSSSSYKLLQKLFLTREIDSGL